MIGCGLALNDTWFILVQAMCPTSSLSRSVTLFLSLGARSFAVGLQTRGSKMRGIRDPVGLRTEGPRVTGAPTCAKCLNVCCSLESLVVRVILIGRERIPFYRFKGMALQVRVRE